MLAEPNEVQVSPIQGGVGWGCEPTMSSAPATEREYAELQLRGLLTELQLRGLLRPLLAEREQGLVKRIL